MMLLTAHGVLVQLLELGERDKVVLDLRNLAIVLDLGDEGILVTCPRSDTSAEKPCLLRLTGVKSESFWRVSSYSWSTFVKFFFAGVILHPET